MFPSYYLFENLYPQIIRTTFSNRVVLNHAFDIISNDANLYAEMPVLNGYAPPPVKVLGFNHS